VTYSAVYSTSTAELHERIYAPYGLLTDQHLQPCLAGLA
jgi:hypothetical protein